MTQEITPKIQDQLNLSALILKKNYKSADLTSWSGFDLENQMDVKQAKRLLSLYGIKSGLHLRNSLQRYENGEMVSNTFEKLAIEFRMSTTKDFDAKYNAEENPKTKGIYKMVWKYRFSLKKQKLFGYEMAYYIFQMRLGHVLGFIDTREMILRLEEANETIKSTFSSWGEFHRNVCLGDEYVLGTTEQDVSKFPGMETLWECYQRLYIEHADWFKTWKK
ncbi:DUF1266 domain-containing protein [Polaribacter sp. HaHaR_3_91]|uniref:DUF1266 domain-containing protein n=1 Tax=Polaribacter sp. HaHaR_3_91 TaxID=2745561 RepID=UPI001C4EEFCA|nr:DUF1266 domain-containing protein [Polaribacter sp. HaHaR_3_91]QXP65157.1 DUF1266 domain-containing protein [Polaribacter sp. HaHaR_3_91]